MFVLYIFGKYANIFNLCILCKVFTAAIAWALATVDVSVVTRTDISVRLQDRSGGGLNVVLNKNGGSSTVISEIGRNAGTSTGLTQGNSDMSISFPGGITLRVTTQHFQVPRNGFVINVEWQAPTNSQLVDCVKLGSHNWYGGPEQRHQYWPIEKLVLSEYSYITKETDNCAIAEPYWLNSDGVFYFIDKKVPLFIDQNVMKNNSLCFIAQVKAPYSSRRERLELAYVIGIFDDVRQAHEHAVATVLGKPTGYPDEKMITYPIWSTWVRHKRDVTHSFVLAFADEINNHGFPNSQLEIDDLWEVCYGSQSVDVNRFPNMTETVDTLKRKGFRVTIWSHPFVNKGCEPWYTEAINNGYFILSESGSPDTSWWNSNDTVPAGYIDFTKPEARKWYVDRLELLRNSHGIDSFKFDAGETSWSPQIPVLRTDLDGQPSAITTEYVRTVAQFGPLVEVRSGYRTQDLPIFVRMIDRDTYWTFENGLPSLITTLLQMNINGYTLVLPDMIGGNGYDITSNILPSKELFIRWLQTNVFMPSLQFSYVPWDYDTETIEISKQFVNLHEQYAPEIIKAFQHSVSYGSPVNAPIWWIAPNDTTAHGIWDEFLLGENILVAPVVTENATSRDIYLPLGKWLELNDTEKVHEGPMWIRNYSAPLNVLPYFIRDHSVTSRATSIAGISVFLLLLELIFHNF